MKLETQNKIREIINEFGVDPLKYADNAPIYMVAFYFAGDEASQYEYTLDIGGIRFTLPSKKIYEDMQAEFDKHNIFYLEEYLGDYYKALNYTMLSKKIINLFGEPE